MPSLTYNELKTFSKWRSSIFIETGTYTGETVSNMITEFDKIYSIELSEKYANNANRKFRFNDNVTIINGDSIDVLNLLSSEIKDSVFFWLDGHWSGGDTARGSVDCPLLEEIKIINDKYMVECIVAIDDVRLFGTNIDQDWTNITKNNVLNIVGDRLVSYEYFPSVLDLEDRMVLHLRA